MNWFFLEAFYKNWFINIYYSEHDIFISISVNKKIFVEANFAFI